MLETLQGTAHCEEERVNLYVACVAVCCSVNCRVCCRVCCRDWGLCSALLTVKKRELTYMLQCVAVCFSVCCRVCCRVCCSGWRLCKVLVTVNKGESTSGMYVYIRVTNYSYVSQELYLHVVGHCEEGRVDLWYECIHTSHELCIRESRTLFTCRWSL